MSGHISQLAGIKRLLFFLGHPGWLILRAGWLFLRQTWHSLVRFNRRPAATLVKPQLVVSVPSETEFIWYWHNNWLRRHYQEIIFEFYWWRQQRLKRHHAKIIWQLPTPTFPSWLILAGWSLICLSLFSWGTYYFILRDLPSPLAIKSRSPIVSTKIYDRRGRLLYTIFKDENRTIVPLADISPQMTAATLAIEDSEFYHHFGLSFRGIARAFWHNLRHESTQGGSTITQQLVKNILLTSDRTWQRKIREAVLALAVDALYTKDEILYHYLNEVNYGGSVYGVEEASQWYFAKSAKDLTLAESAFLAGLPAAPSIYSPFSATPQLGEQRRQEVLQLMLAQGAITAEQFKQASEQQLTFQTATYDIQAPHFVMYVRSLLAQQFGEALVSQGGLEVYTTLDLDIQASASAAVQKEVERLAKLNVGNGAALVTDPRSGAILAMVGSRGYFDANHDGSVNLTLRPRQPGSSIKPVTYALAFERGHKPSDTIEDKPVMYTVPGSPAYIPRNYDGRFHGKVTLREALASSYNVPAVRLLVELGVPSLVEQGRKMGITTWQDPTRFGLALTLGSGEVTMHDMAQVYGTFANQGETVPLNPLLYVRRWDGRSLYVNPCADASSPCGGERTISPLTAYEITSVLSDNAARTPAFGPRSVLNLPQQEVAVKTGTTNSLRDNWTIGYTTDRVVLTWVGNNDNTPMNRVASGVTGASPIWNQIMSSQLAGQTHAFALPSGMEKVAVCRPTGTLPCQQCPAVSTEIFLTGMAPTQHCTAAMFPPPAEGATLQASGDTRVTP